MKTIIKLAGILMFAGFLSYQSAAQSAGKKLNMWAYDIIHIAPSESTKSRMDPVVVAVVDDAFRLSHKAIRDFIYKNPSEVPDNQADDDGNNYVDDVFGWDIADNDSDVSVPEGRDKVFFHGTYISSIICKVANLHYGESASKKIKIMPVKVLSDFATRTYMSYGYRGVRYAMDNGADIICLAWSGGNPGTEELKVIREAHMKGILIISSAGNFNEEKILNPALAPEVLAVAGINMKLQKEEKSNYGMDADISAPAEFVMGAHPEKDNAYIHDNGTSASAALVAGCAAIIMSKKEDLSNLDVKEALLNTSTPFDKHFLKYGGKLGTGIVNLEEALEYISNPSDRSSYFSSLRPKGSLLIDAESKKQNWEIGPAGAYHGFYLEPNISDIKKPDEHSLNIMINDTIWNQYNFSNMPKKLFVPSSSLKVMMRNNSFEKSDVFKINYHGKTIDSTELYCSGLRYLNLEKGSVNDGSGESNYANNCSCKWIITVPTGKKIKFIFDLMDTQANVDFVNLVDGRTAIPENFIAKFSGQNIPPVVVSQTNEVLVWFVTDKDTTGQGWQFHYEIVE